MRRLINFWRIRSLREHEQLGIALAIIGFEITDKLLDNLAKNDDFPYMSKDDKQPPSDIARGATIATFWNIIEEVYYRDYFSLGVDKAKECINVTRKVLLSNWAQIDDAHIDTCIIYIQEQFKKDNSMYLLRVASVICPRTTDITILLPLSIEFSASVKFYHVPLLDQIRGKSKRELVRFIEDYFNEMHLKFS